MTDEPSDARSSRDGGGGPRLRSRAVRLVLAACLVLIGAGVALLVVHGARRPPAPARAVALGTATVRRGNLIAVRHYHGRLGYASRASVHLSATGTVTSLPHVGQVLSEGVAVAGVDDRAVGVLLGAGALYRTLGSTSTASDRLAVRADHADLLAAQAALAEAQSPHGGSGGAGAATQSSGATAASPTGAADLAQARVSVSQARAHLRAARLTLRQAGAPQEGPDVALVAANMEALGYYHGITDVWNASLQDAVRDWQEHIGAAASGDIDPADVLVLGGAERVTGVKGAVGGAPSSVTISLTSHTRVATFRVKGGVPARLRRGRHVTISAGGGTVAGRVARVTTGHGSAATGGQATATIQVAFRQSSAVARTSATRVSSTVVTSARRNVLIVPTQALLALASGGYALQLPGGRLLAIHTGVVLGSNVEVTGRGVHPGLRVVSVT